MLILNFKKCRWIVEWGMGCMQQVPCRTLEMNPVETVLKYFNQCLHFLNVLKQKLKIIFAQKSSCTGRLRSSPSCTQLVAPGEDPCLFCVKRYI